MTFADTIDAALEEEIETLAKRFCDETNKEKAIKILESSIQKTEEEKARLQDKAAEKKKELGGISYITSIFSFRRKSSVRLNTIGFYSIF